MQEQTYKLSGHTRIGHVHLKVSNIEKSLDFYCGLLGFELQQRLGADAAFISAGGYHHHIGLNTWQSKGQSPAPKHFPGLFHTAILFEERINLAKAVKRLLDKGYPLTGAADHGVSEAIYLDDPDKNGVELYWDRPEHLWPRQQDGSLAMYTRALNMEDLLSEIV